jgi:hypothetical protein
VRAALKTALAAHLDDYLDGRLPPACLLIIAGVELPAAPSILDNSRDAESSHVKSQNRFISAGELWILGYEGTGVHLKEREGMRIVALLLAHKGRRFTAADVEAELRPAPPSTDRIHLEEEGLTAEGYGSGGTVSDRRAIREYRAALADLDEDIAEARENNDPERVARLGEARQAYMDEIRQATGPGGKLRTFADNVSKQHERVSRNLRRTIAAIGKRHASLGEHLDQSIRRSTEFIYAPEPDVHWEVRPPVT